MKSFFVVRRYQAILVCLLFFLLVNTKLTSRGSELNPSLLPLLEKYKKAEVEQPPKINVVIAPVPVPQPKPIAKPKMFHRIALTFDDGPYPGFTEKLLDILKKEKVKATFFVIGKNVEKYPETLQKIAKEGHEIAGHTYTHRNLTQIPVEEIMVELELTRTLIEKTVNQRSYLFRPPGGQYNKKVMDLSNKGGYKMVLWTTLPGDHARPEPGIIYARTMESVFDGGVIVLHSGVKQTLVALPKIIQKLKAKGYEFQTVSKIVTTEKNQEKLYAYYKP